MLEIVGPDFRETETGMGGAAPGCITLYHTRCQSWASRGDNDPGRPTEDRGDGGHPIDHGSNAGRESRVARRNRLARCNAKIDFKLAN